MTPGWTRRRDRRTLKLLAAFLMIAVLTGVVAGCSSSPSGEGSSTHAASPRFSPRSPAAVRCDEDSGGLTLPEGFCALVAADDLGRVRHIAVHASGNLYAALLRSEGGGVVALGDSDGDGRFDQEHRFGTEGGTGLEIHGGFLYVGSDTAVRRFPLGESELAPAGPAETVVSGFPEQDQHAAKSLALDQAGGLYVNVGAPSNACQQQARTPGSPGQDPCPQLEMQGGIWRFDARRTGQAHMPGNRFAGGIRNAVAIAWNTSGESLYVVQHGRDQLHQLWPERFSQQESNRLPAEEMLEVDPGDDFGWPYCYFDGQKSRKLLAPEYGGDGEKAGRCESFKDPVHAFPAHWAPNDLIFYEGEQFPARYRGGAFIAFHGSWNREPEQAGYQVIFLPFKDGLPAGEHEVFAEGFTGREVLASPRDARHRPMGLAVGPDGSLFIADSVKGRIWRVLHP